MQPTSQDPQQTPDSQPTPPDQKSEQSATPQAFTVKKSRKPLIISLTALVALVVAGCAGWYWWSLQQPVDTAAPDLPSQNSQQQKLPEPNTIAYAYSATLDIARDLFWRPADGGEKQNTPAKAFVGSSKTLGNQVLIETYYNEPTKTAPSILYSKDGGKTYETIFTAKAPESSTDMGDQITGMVFASDGKSVLFGVLPSPAGKNTVKQVIFDRPNETIDIMTSDAAGVFPIAFNAKLQLFAFSEGCYNCDGNGASTSVFAYNVTSKKRSTLIDGADKHLGMISNKAATKLLITTPTVDKTKTGSEGDGFWGYYVGAPYKFTIFELATGKTQDPGTTVGTTADNKYVRGGFMTDDATPYYFSGNQLFMLDKATPTLLYEAGQPIHEVFYVSPTTVFASTGDYVNFTLNRFGIKTQETKQLLTGDDTTTRIFGITEN